MPEQGRREPWVQKVVNATDRLLHRISESGADDAFIVARSRKCVDSSRELLQVMKQRSDQDA